MPKPSRTSRQYLSSFVLLLVYSLSPSEALALRPFESTDADVVAAGEYELEFGIFTLERDESLNSYIAPSLVLNYGLSDSLELVGEFDLEKAHDESWKLVDPGLFLKSMLKNGSLQGNSGFSLAAEYGVLLPTGRDQDGKLGAEGILIFSNELSSFGYHLNFGGGVNTNGDSFRLWGLIGEYSISDELTLVGEISGEKVTGESTEDSILAGLVYEPRNSNMQWDFGIRHGITEAGADTVLTLGFTTKF